MPDDSPLQPQTPDSLMLFGFWYRALPGDQVKRERAVAKPCCSKSARHRP